MQWGETTTTPMTDEMRREWDKVDWDKVTPLIDWPGKDEESNKFTGKFFKGYSPQFYFR